MTSAHPVTNFIDDEDIYGKVSPPAETAKKFEAWHRPRKQWVRSCQWSNSLSALLDKSSYSSVEVIEYFGFPGSDCLDIQVLGQKLGVKNKKLCFYGLETKTAAYVRAQSVVESILYDLPFISQHSRIEPSSKFEVVRMPSSKISTDIKDRNPFHVINLDFINSIYSASEGKETMQAILQLLEYQFNRQYKPWLLFATFRCDTQASCRNILKEYAEVLSENIKDHENFRNEINEKIFACEAEKIWTADELASNDPCFENILILSFLKWVLKNAVSKNVKMKVLSSACYKVRDQNLKPDMMSLVIEFEKIDNAIDVTDVTHTDVQPIDELDLALKLIGKASGAKDVDELLIQDTALNSRMLDEVKPLLQRIGYDISTYPYN